MKYLSFAVLALLVVPISIDADQLVTTTGEVIEGTVVSVDEHFVKLRVDDGTVQSQPRRFIRHMSFSPASESVQPAKQQSQQPQQDAPPKKLAPNDFQRGMPAFPTSERMRLEELLGYPSDPSKTPADVIRELQYSGEVPPEALKQIRTLFPLLNDPAASHVFNNTIAGLISGEKTLEDLRSEAIQARRKLAAVRSLLGADSSQMIDRYDQILAKFIAESAPAEKSAPTDRTTQEPSGPLESDR